MRFRMDPRAKLYLLLLANLMLFFHVSLAAEAIMAVLFLLLLLILLLLLLSHLSSDSLLLAY